MPLSGAGLGAFLALFVAGIYALARNGFDNDFAGLLGVRSLTVDTWAEWCDHVVGANLHAKYGAMTVSYEADSIRADFIREFLPIFAAGAAGPLADELVRSGRLRVWNEGSTIHLVNSAAPDLAGWKRSVERSLAEDWTRLPHQEFLVNATLASMFREMTLEGSRGHTASIRLPFVFGE